MRERRHSSAVPRVLLAKGKTAYTGGVQLPAIARAVSGHIRSRAGPNTVKRLLASLVLMLPLAAVGQTLPAPSTGPQRPALAYGAPKLSGPHTGVVIPLWRAADGRMLALVSTSASAGERDAAPDRGEASVAPAFSVVDASALFAQSLRYDVTPHLQTQVTVSRRSWLVPAANAQAAGGCVPSANIGCLDGHLMSPLGWVNGELGATFSGEHYSVGVSVGSGRPTQSSAHAVLPRILPNASLLSADGVPYGALDDSSHVSARGRLALGQDSGIDVGASVGRIRLLPGNPLGIDALGQKSLSLGLDSGPVSGNITGRLVQPEAGTATLNPLGPDRHWTSIDLGVTVRLPWQGRLSFGAQNLWSSGQQTAAAPTPGAEPDQSRIPYVQYHQDL